MSRFIKSNVWLYFVVKLKVISDIMFDAQRFRKENHATFVRVMISRQS
jgi:hypothetical protein